MKMNLVPKVLDALDNAIQGRALSDEDKQILLELHVEIMALAVKIVFK